MVEQDDEHRLRATARLAAIVASSHDAIISKTLDGIVTSWNAGAERIFGYAAEEVIGQPIVRLFRPDRRDEEAKLLARIRSKQPVASFDTVRRRKDGKDIDVSVSLSPVCDPGGKVIGVSKIARDISDQKRLQRSLVSAKAAAEDAREALRRSEERLSLALSSSALGLWDWDLARDEAYLSPDYLRMLGYAEGEVHADSAFFTGSIHPDDTRGVRKTMREHLRGKTSRSVLECRMRTKLGDYRWFHGEGRVTERAPGGAPLRMVGVIMDITARKHMEERMLRFAQELLVAREEERKQVAAVLHHELGSMMVVVSSNLDGLEQDAKLGKLGDVLRCTKRTRKAFDHSVKRLRATAVQLRPPEIDLLGLPGTLRQLCAQVTKGGTALVSFHQVGTARWPVPAAAATVLFRVAQEAVTNGIRHGRATHVKVALRTAKGRVLLTVHDDGGGFEPAEARGSGSRMGLLVMRELMASVGGSFTVASTPETGTKVTARVTIIAPNKNTAEA